MKVILQRDVAKIGRRFEVVEVPDGFALNKLIPQGDARPATASNIKSIAAQQKKAEQNKDQVIADFKDICKQLVETPLKIEVTANKEGHLFKAVSAEDIRAAAKAVEVDLPTEYIVVNETIKSLGEASINLKCFDESVSLTVNILAK